MTACSMVVQQVFDAMEPHQRYYFHNLRALESLRGIEDQRLRNALVGLQSNGRVMRTGTHARYRYYINPIQPLLRADAAKAKRRLLTVKPSTTPTTTAIAANWPAVGISTRFDAAPQWRISA